MHKLAILLLPSLMLAAPIQAAASDVQAITDLEAKWTAAFLTHDVKFVGSVVAPDWVGFDPEGKRHDRAAMLAHIADKKGVTISARNHDVAVRVFGNIAVAQGYETEKSSFNGKDTSGTYFWTDVFKRQATGWVVVTSQTAKMP